jgi:lysophospholipase L1-like esterase
VAAALFWHASPDPSTATSGALPMGRFSIDRGDVGNVLRKVLLVCVSTAISVYLMECGLRVHHYGSLGSLSGEHTVREPHPVLGWALEAGATAFQRSRDYGVKVEINEDGLRDRAHALDSAPGVSRIAVLGDSFMEAYQVELEESLPYLLQETFADRRVEVINFGVGGYGTAQALLALREKGLRYSPELVVLAFFTGNDVQNNSRELQNLIWGADELKAFGRPYLVADTLQSEIVWMLPDRERVEQLVSEARARRASLSRRIGKFVQPSMLGHVFERALARVRPDATGFDPNVMFGWTYTENFDPDHPAATLDVAGYERVFDEAWRVTRRAILGIRDLAASSGARFAVLIVPSREQVVPAFGRAVEQQFPELRFDWLRINREMARFCASAGIPLLDPTQALVGAAGVAPVYYEIEDRHWSPRGHAVVVAELADFLDREHLVPSDAAVRERAK